MTRVALVVNPLKAEDAEGSTAALHSKVSKACIDAGWGEPMCLETTEADPGQGMAKQAVEASVDLVIVAGGDGTVRAVATGLAESGVPLGVLPLGTGNLLARNLDLSTDLDDALAMLREHSDRAIDLGRLLSGDGRDQDAGEHFAVMAGMGFDAAMMDNAPEGLKERVGWLAYVIAGARRLRDRGFPVRIRIDDGPWSRRRVRGVLIGNVGRLQGGLELMPEAAPDDGMLDVAVLAPRSVGDWVVLAWHVMRGAPQRAGRRLETLRGRQVSVVATTPQPRELDGDVISPSHRLDVEIRPRALVLRAPATPDDHGSTA